MKRIKSRNFVLIVCGIFFFIMFCFLIAVGVLRIADKVSEDNIYDSISLKSSKIEVGGDANFVESTPIVIKSNIKNFNVKLKKYGDFARFIVELCNLDENDLIIEDIVNSDIVCNDGMKDVNCDGIKVNGYVKKDSNSFNSGQCINFVLEAEAVSDFSQETFVFVSEYEIRLKKFNDK